MSVFLAETTKQVHMLVRSVGLAKTMSSYLIRRIEETPNIVVQPYTEIMALQGGDHLESVMWRNNQTELTEEHKIRHVFLMTGADPNTGWLNGCLALDARSFIWMRDIRCVASIKIKSSCIHIAERRYVGHQEVSYDRRQKFDTMLVTLSMREDQILRQSSIG